MQLILDFKNDATQEQIDSFIASNNLTDVQVLSEAQKCYLVTSDVELVSTGDVLITSNESKLVKLLTTYPKQSFNTYSPSNWWKVASFVRPDLEQEIQTYDRRGDKSVIYLVDSGINTTHIEFANANIQNLYTFNGNWADANGHGTALASVMVGETCGLTNATVKSVKIFENGFETRYSHIIEAIDAIINDVIANPFGVKIVNMSWAIAKDAFIESKIQLLINAGVKVVAAAGNSGTLIENVTPASMNDVYTVGAYNQDFEPCDFSNYTGPISTTGNITNYGAIDVWAPGIDIPAVVSFAQINNIAGTSVAAAIQTAAFAYNSDHNVLSDGTLPAAISATSDMESFSNTGILYLTGVYENSTKYTTIYRGDYDGQNGIFYRTVTNFNIRVKSGEKISVNTFPFYVTDNFTIQNPLPEGVVFDNGWIEGTIGTPQDSQTFYWESPVTYTKHGGLEKQGTLRISVLPASVDPATLPQDDPAVKLTLMAYCGAVVTNGIWSCEGACGQGWCYDVCQAYKPTSQGEVACYCAADGKTYDCP